MKRTRARWLVLGWSVFVLLWVFVLAIVGEYLARGWLAAQWSRAETISAGRAEQNRASMRAEANRDARGQTRDAGAKESSLRGRRSHAGQHPSRGLRSTDGPTAAPLTGSCGATVTETRGLLWLFPCR
jgi:hypothetical protein